VRTLVTPRGTNRNAPDDLWLDADTLATATGWHLRPEGLCRDDVCLLVPDELRRDDEVDVVALWQRLGRPVLTAGDATYLGEDAAARPSLKAGDPAPDFTLPDLAGNQHSLSDFRGKKVFISSWAPW
jgi:hypothetical protein